MKSGEGGGGEEKDAHSSHALAKRRIDLSSHVDTVGTSPVSAPGAGSSPEAPDRGTLWPESRAKSHLERSCMPTRTDIYTSIVL